MNTQMGKSVALAALALSLGGGAARAATPVVGEYVESRSANVFVGACHHEGEVQTAGRNAVMAWNITSGDYKGVDLSGVKVMAVVAADRYLGLPGAQRQSVIYVDGSISAERRDAAVSWLRDRAAAALGEVRGVKNAEITFESGEKLFNVRVAGVAYMKIRKETAELCCKQPYETWGKPFVPVVAAKTGYCVGVEYKDAGMLKSWSATDQNNAFFGKFSL